MFDLPFGHIIDPLLEMTGIGKIASSNILVIHPSESGDVQNPIPKVRMTASVVFSILYLNSIFNEIIILM